jgi:hypothetical protein
MLVMSTTINFDNKIVNLKLENDIQLSIRATNGKIIEINGEKASGSVVSVKIIAGKYKGNQLWFDFLYNLSTNLLSAQEMLQHSFRPIAYLIVKNEPKELEKSALVGFHFIEE